MQPMTATFECAWCYQANRADHEYNRTHSASIEPTEYIYPIGLIGGYDKDSNLPICEGCADAAAEDTAR